MKETGMVKRIDNLGRIVVPKDIRKKLGVNNLDSVEFFVDGDAVVLKKYGKACAFCGDDTDDFVPFKEKFICRACLDELKK